MRSGKIILTGGAGLVGQNLIITLKLAGFDNIVVIDKHRTNLETLRLLHPDITIEYADLAEQGHWEKNFEDADVTVMLQAQIGDLRESSFVRNNVISTDRVLNAVKRNQVPCTIHVSSSVVMSVADDHYTKTKREQERMVLESGIDCVALRPTLMFGWFDRKHLGWLSRLMQSVPVFPVPGDGKYMRQPLYVRDFCNIILRCIEEPVKGRVYPITGLEKIDYIDIIRQLKKATGSRAVILKIPYVVFYFLLKTWCLFDKHPPFTTDQLEALVAHDEFEVIDWPGIFGVTPTPFTRAIDETFNDKTYSNIRLEF